jgi:hypothetical protein
MTRGLMLASTTHLSIVVVFTLIWRLSQRPANSFTIVEFHDTSPLWIWKASSPWTSLAVQRVTMYRT